ncbi:hypothetical protein BC830DRAFT_1175797 [Chytriomyces sp. MP71]|nr:hypothetical protein BC830DRAFT_1175797 [Chytriomyces sp. MP71]
MLSTQRAALFQGEYLSLGVSLLFCVQNLLGEHMFLRGLFPVSVGTRTASRQPLRTFSSLLPQQGGDGRGKASLTGDGVWASEPLTQLLTHFDAPIRFAAGYGSGVLKQEGYGDKVQNFELKCCRVGN